MLEIILASLLIKGVKNNAVSRGRKPGGFIALAIILWVIPELIGICIGAYFELGYGTFVIAYGLVGIGVLISYNVSKFCAKGDYVPPNELLIRQFTEYYEPLPAMQNVTITREKAFSGSAARYEMSLNGKLVGSVGNGEVLHAMTDQRQNVISVRLPGGNEIAPFVFQVADGLDADIHFAAGRFLPERSTGIVAYGQAVMINPAIAKARYVPVVENGPVAPVYAPVYSAPAQPNPAYVPVQQPVNAAPVQQAVYSAPVQQPENAVPAQQAVAAAPAPSGGFCEHCGNPLPADAKFCGSCGARIES